MFGLQHISAETPPLCPWKGVQPHNRFLSKGSMSWKWNGESKAEWEPTMHMHGAVRDPGDLPDDWFGNQPKEQLGSGAARRGNWIYRPGSAAYHLQYYHSGREGSGRANVAKQRGISKVGAALLLGRTQ